MLCQVSALVFLVTLNVVAAQFSCPTTHITKDNGIFGAIPTGAASMVTVPAGVDCTYFFDIPKGFAVKLETTALYDVSPGDSIRFDYFYISSPAEKRIEFAVNQTLPFHVVSVTGNLQFFATYTYIDMTGYQQVVQPTGTFFNSTLEANKYLTFKSAENEQVAVKYGSLQSGFADSSIYEIFVFDGNDITNAEYLGRFTELYHAPQYAIYSTSNTLTFLNLYRTPSNSMLLANDASVIENYEVYNIMVLDSVNPYSGYMSNYYDDADAYFTVICDGCSSINIKTLIFDSKYKNGAGYLEVAEMSPTQKLPAKLNYPASTSPSNRLPQLISSQMATFHTFNARVTYGIQGVN
ncbi:CUB-like domain-containing protein [Caenorhabditis elegans]|uniref:CUB-like domain-containing protein n=1 Tax=Caenorhabditis elegans TaxID=6239 RepID=O02358_CAEEL|nr:CUB-like domain-containing protein [Caenorhabditis elegans]CAB04273.2 CUB-like domain-containing protein [Caenorhabditis elegans]|eukprot:NP_506401.2 Uncharacterized protein CELE_F35E12.6 [Caenorhabditis elegans]